jgi:hypothetical protein
VGHMTVLFKRVKPGNYDVILNSSHKLYKVSYINIHLVHGILPIEACKLDYSLSL